VISGLSCGILLVVDLVLVLFVMIVLRWFVRYLDVILGLFDCWQFTLWVVV